MLQYFNGLEETYCALEQPPSGSVRTQPQEDIRHPETHVYDFMAYAP